MNKSMQIAIKFICVVIGMMGISLYVYNYFRLPGILHCEVPLDMEGFMSGGMSGIKDMLSKVFNLTIVEGGQYRPRIGAFIIQYYDIKWWCLLNKYFAWGGHYPFILISVPLYMFGVRLWLKGFFIEIQNIYCFALGGVLLFLPHYQASEFLFLRSAKVISVCIAFGVIGFYFINMNKEYSDKKVWKSILFAFLFSLLCTIDEQILGVMVILGGLSILQSAFNKKITVNAYIFWGSIFFYFIFYYTWGKALCAYFTPIPLSKHYHDMGKLIYFYDYILDGTRMYIMALVRLMWNSKIILGIILIAWFGGVIRLKKLQYIMTSIYLFFSGLLFSIMLVTAHPTIASLEEQPKGLYFNISVCWALTSFIYTVSKQKFPMKGSIICHIIFFILPILNFLFIQYNIREYELTHATQGGEFMISSSVLNDFFYSDAAEAMEVEWDYFSGLLIGASDYEKYYEIYGIGEGL